VFVAAANFTTSNGVSRFTGRVNIGTNGVCTFVMPAGSTGDFLYLDGVRYSID
jgi:hypothetical protein